MGLLLNFFLLLYQCLHLIFWVFACVFSLWIVDFGGLVIVLLVMFITWSDACCCGLEVYWFFYLWFCYSWNRKLYHLSMLHGEWGILPKYCAHYSRVSSLILRYYILQFRWPSLWCIIYAKLIKKLPPNEPLSWDGLEY